MNSLWILLSLVLVTRGAEIISMPPNRPASISTEPLIKAWVEQAVDKCPPVGPKVSMMKHWPPHYAKNDRVIEIWIIPALVKVVSDDGSIEHEMAFVVYHVDTGETTVEILFAIREQDLEKYMANDPKEKTI